ncbi:SDR family NAD(P)-dependent oxidoreductase [Sphingobium sp. Sx8-8]|uniref:SDR family NAD(P)-dependent oxidoreductase n=1 Tax=Sphingobium sp. Sx8-8 TaxID=2933617 RepID=UPI001F599935|nr:SDR family NAD(P)-dependent oxidoreductase [Sphingobium sp. Sx8-8]
MSGQKMDLTGKVAIITGSGTGIGRASAVLLAQQGADIVLAGRKEGPLDESAGQVRALGRRASVIPTDVKDSDACEALVARTMEEFGRIDILLNNAGGSRAKSLDAWTLADFHDMIALNLTSVWVLSLAAARHMRGTGGSIINISSMASLRAVPHSAPYGVAKAGVNNMTSVMAVDLAPFGIRVNCIAVGTIKSEGYIRAMERMGLDPDVSGAGNPMGRPGLPEEIAWPVLFLASDASSYVTGQTLAVNGGMALRP